MKWLTFKIQKKAGFRFNLIDLSLILFLLLVAWLFYDNAPETGLHYFPIYLGFTFFTFCNVFRVGNRIEPIWYLPFGVMMLWSLYRMEVAWGTILAIFVPLQVALILYRIIRGPYVGIMYERVGKFDPDRIAKE